MKMSQLLIASAVAAALAVPIVSQAGPAPKPKFQAEKCYGIAKAGNNDCLSFAKTSFDRLHAIRDPGHGREPDLRRGDPISPTAGGARINAIRQ
jgi:uncharacterized membrane protein